MDLVEKLRLIYALRAGGDARTLAQLAAQVDADVAELRGPAKGAGVVAGSHIVANPGEPVEVYEVMGDGSQRVKA